MNSRNVSLSSPFIPPQPLSHGPLPHPAACIEQLAPPAWAQDTATHACSRGRGRPLALLSNTGEQRHFYKHLVLTNERLRSPNRCQRSDTVFHPTCRMIKRPTNLTPIAPARLMPVRLSQNHQGAEKGLKTNKTQSSVWQLEPNSKARASVGKGAGSLTLRGCAVPSL